MQLRALLSLCAVVGCARPTFRRRAQGSAVDDGDGRLRGTSCREAQDNAQILGQRLEAAGAQPSPRLLIDDLPRRQVVGHPTPRRAGLHDIAQAVEHLAQGVHALSALFRQKRRTGRNKRPLLIRNIGRIRFADCVIPQTSESMVNQSLTASRVRGPEGRTERWSDPRLTEAQTIAVLLRGGSN